MADEPTGRPAGEKPRKRADRPAVTIARPKPSKVARQVKLPPDLDLKLQSHALGTGRSASEIVAELIRAMPTEFVLHRHRRGAAPPDQPAAADPSPAPETAA